MVKPIAATSISLLIWFLVSVRVHVLPHGVSNRTAAPLFAGAELTQSVTADFERACANCHSEKTRWPWYSQWAPMSWVVENDVREARKHLNLSQWDRLDADEQRLALTSIATVIENGEMPPHRYIIFHPEAKLSTEAAVQIIEWTRRERHRLRSLASPGTPKSPSPGIYLQPREYWGLREIKSEQE